MILDGMNMEVGARRGIEKITREIRKKLIWYRTIDTTIGLFLFTLSTYFKKSKQYHYQSIPVIIALTLNALIAFGYNAHSLKETGRKIVFILLRTIRSNSNGNFNATTLENNYKLSTAYKKFRKIIPIVVVILGVSSFLSFLIPIWAAVTMGTNVGMAWGSSYVAFIVTFWMLPAFMIGNKLLIVWFVPEVITSQRVS